MDMQFLKRFPESKQEQIRQLMGYISLLGVSGKDLISIGGYIERSKKKEQAEHLRDIAMSYNPQHIRGDAQSRTNLCRRFKIEYQGRWYAFEMEHYRHWKITSRQTGKRVTHSPAWHDWGAWTQRRGYTARLELNMYDVLLDIHDGRLQLNF